MWMPISVLRKNSVKKFQLLAPLLKNNESIMDFGCGDLTLAKTLLSYKKNLSITGIDVVDFGQRHPGISFKKYNGKKIPYPANHFDTVISYYVLHHTDDAVFYFKELVRVAKKRVILIESVARYPFEFPGMKVMDWIFNIWKSEKIPFPFTFLGKKEWYRVFKEAGLSVRLEKDAEVMPIPKFMPVGRSTLFELVKK
jgi:ubiquinone/menaquinone biosynthesis C-methylase UbiE